MRITVDCTCCCISRAEIQFIAKFQVNHKEAKICKDCLVVVVVVVVVVVAAAAAVVVVVVVVVSVFVVVVFLY